MAMNRDWQAKRGLIYHDTSARAKKSYVVNPTGEIDIPRLIEGKSSYWVQYDHAQINKKKKIVISDWRIAYKIANFEESSKLTDVLSELLADGFELYAWNGKLISIKTREELIEALDEIKPISRELLKKELSNSSLSSDECFIADVAENIADDKNKILRLGDLIKLPSQLTDELMESIPANKITLLIENKVHPEKNNVAIANALLKKFNLEFEDSIEKKWVDSIEFENLNLSAVKFSGVIENEDMIELPDKYFQKMIYNQKETKDIILDSKNFSDESAVLNNLNKLKYQPKSLELNFFRKMNKFKPDSSVFQDLTRLEINFSAIGDLEELIGSLPSLKSLDIRVDENSVYTKKDENLLGITSLSISSNAQYKLDEFNKLLRTCPMLTELTLPKKPKGSVIDWDLSNCNKINTLSLNTSNVKPDYIRNILKTNADLTRLTLLEMGDGIGMLELPTLKNLTYLRVSGKLSADKLNDILKSCPNLRTLDLSGCEFDFQKMDLSLCPVLATLTMDYNLRSMEFTISSQEISYLTKKSEALLHLQLEGIDDISTAIGWTNNPKVRSISIIGCSQVASEAVTKSIQACPGLEHLFLDRIGDIAGLNFSKNKKLKLVELNVSCEDSLNYNNVSKLLKSCGEKTVLRLSHGFEGFEKLKKVYPNLVIVDEKKREDPMVDPDKVPSKFDSNSSSGQTLKANQFFLPKKNGYPSVGNYRLYVSPNITIDHENQTFEHQHVKAENNKNIKRVEIDQSKFIQSEYEKKYVNSPNIYFGKCKINSSYQKYVPLPQLGPNDEIIKIETQPYTEIDLVYDKVNNIYFVKPKEKNAENFTISFLLKHEQETLDLNALPEQLKKQINTMRLYKDEPIEIKGDTDISLLQDAKNQKRGVCRHRADIFMYDAQVTKEIEVEARKIENEVHAFVEIKVNNKWMQCDLGGGEVNLQIFPMQLIEENPAQLDVAPKISAESTAVKKTQLDQGNRFDTWNKLTSKANTYNEYCHELLTNEKFSKSSQKNILIQLDSKNIENMHAAMVQTTKNKSSKCFYINHLDDIKPKTYAIDNGKYNVIESELANYIKNAKTGDLLIVNWSDYSASDVGHNTIMDKERSICGIPIPPGVIVAGLLDKNVTMSEDFYSRFQFISECPTRLPGINALPIPLSTLDHSQENLPTIEFYTDDWEQELFGSIAINNGKYQFKPSSFVQALESKIGNNGIILRNAPWHLEEFRSKMIDMMEQKRLVVNGKSYPLPNNFQFVRYDKPYSFELGNYNVATHFDDKSSFYILNNRTMTALFKQYRCQNNQIETFDGLIALSKGKSAINLYVTESIDAAAWAHILQEAKNCGVQLNICPGPGVSLAMGKHQLNSNAAQAGNQIIVTNDDNLALKEKQAEINKNTTENAIVISVNMGTTYSDLIDTIARSFSGKEDTFVHKNGALVEALNSGKSVILTGEVSSVLMQQIQSLFCYSPYLMINGERKNYDKGRVTLITKSANELPFVSDARTFKEDDYWAALKVDFIKYQKEYLKLVTTCKSFYESQPSFQHFNYTQLRAMLKRMISSPDKNPLKSMLRLHPQYESTLKQASEKAWPGVNEKMRAFDFERRRVTKIETELKDSPYVFIAGSSGIGKSTTIQSLNNQRGDKVKIFEGMDKLSEWLNVSKEKTNYLFIDEANLYGSGTFDIFAGLMREPPQLLHDGKLHDVPENCKIIFAGNFSHFQGREKHHFFNEHGHIITFKNIPDDYLKDKVILPVLSKIIGDKWSNDQSPNNKVANKFLLAYDYINQLFPVKHPLTARNLQMMSLRFATVKLKNPGIKDDIILGMAVYDEASHLLDKTQKSKYRQWIANHIADVDVKLEKKRLKNTEENKKSFSKNNNVALDQGASVKPPFALTKKRLEPVRQLRQLFDIRDIKIATPELRSMGTSGLILEGEAGIGKSQLAMAFLGARGYVEGSLTADGSAKTYYHITPTDPKKMEAILKKAFHEGAVVIIDEINTLQLEYILNPLLSGVDLDGVKTNKPGFCVIGTQNPVSYGKRQVLSPALLNRLPKMDLKNYNQDDLLEIGRFITNHSSEVDKLVGEFIQAVSFANENKIPSALAPSPRHLMTMFGDIAKAAEKKPTANKIAFDVAILDELEIKFAEAKKKSHTDDPRVMYYTFAISKIASFLKMDPGNAMLKAEELKWKDRVKKILAGDKSPHIDVIPHGGVRQTIAATLSLLLPGGNGRNNAVLGKNIPTIELSRDGMVIRFPDYAGQQGHYGERLSIALRACGYQSISFAKENFENKYGQYKTKITITDHNEIKRLIEKTCCLNEKYTADLYQTAGVVFTSLKK